MAFLDEWSFEYFEMCIEVAKLSDFHPDYFCERALIDNWEVIGVNGFGLVQEIQNFISGFSPEQRYYFLQAINCLLAV